MHVLTVIVCSCLVGGLTSCWKIGNWILLSDVTLLLMRPSVWHQLHGAVLIEVFGPVYVCYATVTLVFLWAPQVGKPTSTFGRTIICCVIEVPCYLILGILSRMHSPRHCCRHIPRFARLTKEIEGHLEFL